MNSENILEAEKVIEIFVRVDGKERMEIPPYPGRTLRTTVVDRNDVADALDEYAKRIRDGEAFEIRGPESAAKTMPGGHPNEAIAPNTLAGKTRDRKFGRR